MIVDISTSKETRLDWCAKGTDRIIQNIYNIISTFKGEVAYNRGLGISPDIIDKPLETQKSILAEDLFDSIKNNEPRAKVKSITINSVNDDGDFSASIKIEI